VPIPYYWLTVAYTGVDKTMLKRNLFDNAINLLTNMLAGSNLKNMPVAEGVVTDLFDRLRVYSPYDWFLEVIMLLCLVLVATLSVSGCGGGGCLSSRPSRCSREVSCTGTSV
jgi:hypothetical protein